MNFIATPRKGIGWCGIWGVDTIPWEGMVLRSYHLIFMGWSGRRDDIMKWSGKFLVYAGVSH